MDDTTLTEIIRDLLEQGERTQKFMQVQESVIAIRDKKIIDLGEQLKAQQQSFEQKYKNISVTATPPDLSGVHMALRAGLANINATLEKKPQPVVRQLRFLFFPENDPQKFYKFIFNRFIPVAASLIMLLETCILARDGIHAYEARQYNEGAKKVVVAWNQVYGEADPKTKTMMDTALLEARK